MYTTPNSRATPSAHQLYRKIVKKISNTEPNYKQLLKKQIADKYDKHMSLLQSHKKRQLRFQQNLTNLQKRKEQNSNRIKLVFKEKQDKIKQSKDSFLTSKKKKIQDALIVWQRTVSENQKKYLNSLQESDNHIKKWNQKCEQSISKKRERLNTISSSIGQRSRILSAKTLKYQQQKYETLLQKSLLNPQNSKSRRQIGKLSSPKPSESRITTRSRVSTDMNNSRLQKGESQKYGRFLQGLLRKQNQIVQARNKKDQLIDKVKKQRNERDLNLNRIHRQNNYYLSTKRSEIESKLDQKFADDRKKRKQANRSLPAINIKNNQSLNYLSKDSVFNTLKSRSSHSKAIQPNYDKLIMEELRNISLVSKIKKSQRS